MNVLKSTPAQLRAAKAYRAKKRVNINLHMKEYYIIHKEEITRKRKDIRIKKKIEKELTLQTNVVKPDVDILKKTKYKQYRTNYYITNKENIKQTI